MSHQALFGFSKELALPENKRYRVALGKEIDNHLVLKSTLGTASGVWTEEDTSLLLARLLIVLQTLNGKPPSMTAPSPVGPEAYAPKAHRDEILRAVERAVANE